jgi:PAS domain S-box-containing protein
MNDSESKSYAEPTGGDRSVEGTRTDYRRIVDSVPGCILVADAEGQIVYANKVALATLGRPLEDLLGVRWLKSLECSVIDDAEKTWLRSVQERKPLNVIWRFRQHDGTYRWQHFKAEPTTDSDAAEVTWYILGFDVDEQFKAEEALRASEQEAREILDRVPAMISIRTEEGIAYTNSRLSDYVGAVITDLRDGSYLDHIHPDDRKAVLEDHIKSSDKGPNDVIYRLRGKDGIYRWFHTRAEPYVGEDGSVYRWYALNSDVDELYRSRELLRERELQLNLLTETLPALLWKTAPDGTIVYMNKTATEYCGRTLEEVKRRGWSDLIHPDDREETLAHWKRLLEEGAGADIVLRFLGCDGRYRWFHAIAASVRDASGKFIAFHSVMLDTTAQKDAELALLQSDQQMQRMMDTVPSMLWSMAPDGSVTFINRKVRDYTGMSLEQIREWGQLEMIHPEEREIAAKNCLEALANGTHFEAEHRIRRVDGLYRWHLRRAEPLINEDGQIIQWFGVDLDIDDQKRAEERTRELRTNVSDTSRTSMGAEISASIAHEINQPLTSVLVNAQACARWLGVVPPKIEEAVASVERIVRDARAVDAVMRNIRLLFKRQPAVKGPCNMVDLIKDAVSLVKEDVNSRFTGIECDFEKPVFMVLADRYQIQQIIINLVRNAFEAMQGSGRVPSLRIRILQTADGQVLTEFIDNGRGLPDHNVDNIFDAFFTTKKSGMGIGLSISRSIVEAHGGQLWAENNPGFGAKFSLILSAAEPMTASE